MLAAQYIERYGIEKSRRIVENAHATAQYADKHYYIRNIKKKDHPIDGYDMTYDYLESYRQRGWKKVATMSGDFDLSSYVNISELRGYIEKLDSFPLGSTVVLQGGKYEGKQWDTVWVVTGFVRSEIAFKARNQFKKQGFNDGAWEFYTSPENLRFATNEEKLINQKI